MTKFKYNTVSAVPAEHTKKLDSSAIAAGDLLPVDTIFGSLNGEGHSSGLFTSFVRVSGCNRQCTWCDTGYGEIPFGDITPKTNFCMSHMQLISFLSHKDSPSITFTGGEPFLYRKFLKKFLSGWRKRTPVYAETCGDFIKAEDVRLFSHLTVSPKMSSSGRGFFKWQRLGEIGVLPDEGRISLKFVIASLADYSEMSRNLERHGLDKLYKGRIYLQPAFEILTHRELCDICVAHGHTSHRVLPQLHKILDIL